MKKEYVQYNLLKRLCLAVASLLVFSGCIKDNINYCTYPSIRVVAVAPVGADPIDPHDVQQVVFYVFDQNEKFIDKFTAPLNVCVRLNYPDERNLYVVGLANVDDASVLVSRLCPGAPMSDGLVSLKQLHDYLSQPIYASASDLFLGEMCITNSLTSEKTFDLPMKRMVAGVNVKIRGLKEFAHTSDEDFRVVVSTDHNAFDFYGNLFGANTNYLPGGMFLSHTPSRYETSGFNIIAEPKGPPITIKIYHGNKLIDTINADSDGNLLTARNGWILEVRIDYIGSVKVTIINAQWGVESVWKDFGATE